MLLRRLGRSKPAWKKVSLYRGVETGHHPILPEAQQIRYSLSHFDLQCHQLERLKQRRCDHQALHSLEKTTLGLSLRIGSAQSDGCTAAKALTEDATYVVG